MQNRAKGVGGLLCAAALVGCTTQVALDPTGEPAAQVTAGKKISAPVAITYAIQVDDTVRKFQCGAYSYVLDARNSITNTLDLENEATFVNIVPNEKDATYVIRIQEDSLEGNIYLIPGFWTASVSANADIVLRVSIMDQQRREIVRTAISGHGTANLPGNCLSAGLPIKQAIEKAIRRVGDEYAYRVLNTLQLP